VIFPFRPSTQFASELLSPPVCLIVSTVAQQCHFGSLQCLNGSAVQ
jgi:hypothetical protein